MSVKIFLCWIYHDWLVKQCFKMQLSQIIWIFVYSQYKCMQPFLNPLPQCAFPNGTVTSIKSHGRHKVSDHLHFCSFLILFRPTTKKTHMFSLVPHCFPILNMMPSSNGNIFRVTGHLCGEFTGPGEFPAQWPVTRSFDIFFDPRSNKRLSKQWWGWWFKTPPTRSPLWRHCNENN